MVLATTTSDSRQSAHSFSRFGSIRSVGSTSTQTPAFFSRSEIGPCSGAATRGCHPFFVSLSRISRQLLKQFRFANKALNGGGQAVSVARFEQQTIFFGNQLFSHCADARAEDYLPQGHAFDKC